MSLQNVEANITLDLYNHDTTPATVKAIQLDNQTRYVAAMLQNVGVQYDVDSGATVQLIVVRPDKVGVQITGTTFTYGDEGAQFLGPYAELTQVALAVSGKMRGQFKITSGEQILRTEIFAISNGEALDASTDTWAGEYQGYNLDELVQNVNEAVATVEGMEQDVNELKSGFTKVASPRNRLNIVYASARPDNLYDSNKIITGYYISPQGVQTASASWCCTDFIDVSGYSTIYLDKIGLSAFYDENKTFVSSFSGGSQTASVAVPANAKYVRSSILPNNVDTAAISYKGWRYLTTTDLPVAEWSIQKKEYQKGFIRFTVPVNQTVATYDNTDEVNNEGSPSYVDVDCVLTLPLEYQPIGKPCKLIMMCHGAGRGVSGTDNWTENTGYLALVDAFMSRGYAVFDCNGFKNDALGWSFWGNQRGIEAWRKAYLYVTNNYNVEKTFSIYAFSMGGLTAMNLAFQGFPNINAIAMGSPVLDLKKVWESTDGTKNVIKTLYGLGDEWDESKVVGNNPYKRVMTIDGVDYCPYKLPPIKIWYGSTETNNSGNPAIEKEIARSFVNALVNSGQYAFYREVSGRGHEICYGNSSTVNAEILTFLQRYEMSRTLHYN